MPDFYVCIDCREIHTGRIDTGKGLIKDPSSPHFGPGHRIRVLEPSKLAPGPIRNGVLHLGAGLPSNRNEERLFALAFELEDYWCPPATSHAPGAGSTSPKSPAPVGPSDASTKSARPSRPTSTTDADLLSLLADQFGATS